MLTQKRNGEFNRQKTFDSFSSYITAVINSFNQLRYKWITFLRYIFVTQKSVTF